MEKLKSALENAIKKIDPHFECEILGSYRRGVGFSSDIDLAVRHRDFIDKDDEETGKVFVNQIVQQLEEDELIERDNQLMLGPKKYAVRHCCLCLLSLVVLTIPSATTGFDEIT